MVDWLEVSESELERICEFGWPLPWNLFRHLTSTLTCRWGLHPDVRDALLGHADRDTEPHGYYSPRIPLDDLEQARPLINRLAKEVGFVMPGNWPLPKVESGLVISKPDTGYTRVFGRKARALKREKTLESARQLALTMITQRLAGRSIDQLDTEAIDKIALAMLFREDGLPHPMGSVRYQVFEKFLAERWTKNGEHAKVSRRYVLILEGRALFAASVIGADDRLSAFRKSFEDFAAHRPTLNERPVMAATMAAIDLVLNSRVANFRTICALLTNHASIQLVRFDKRYWFEWAYGAAWEDGKPVFRVEITQRSAQWISEVLGSRTMSAVPAMPTQIAPVFGALGGEGGNLGQQMKILAALQLQSNALALPGVEAGYLCGARPSAALPHADWIRLVKKAAPVMPKMKTDDDPVDETDAMEAAETFFRHHHRRAQNISGSCLERCKVLFTAISNELNSKDKSNAQIAAEISRAVQTSGFARGDAPFVLAHFSIHLLKRKSKKGKKKRLKAVTALRYWESLSPAFRSIAADINLVDAEEEDLTELYDQLITSTTSTEEIETSSKEGEAAKVVNSSDAPLRALSQLKDFHEFARGTYGLPDPDWSEIGLDIAVGVGRPGIVLEEEYQCILQNILDGESPDALDQDTLSRAFVLVVCARFGLRIGEAVGLHRCDWVDFATTLTLLVRSNSTRTLKTIRSKRQVPLIENLTESELAIFSAVRTAWNHREGSNLRTPLLPGVSHATFRAIKSEIGSRLLAAIKNVTSHEGSTVHMLRHAFAMRVLSLIYGKPLDGQAPADSKEAEQARRLLTGRPEIDKRLLWAVARLLGHASPGVTIKSYLNCWHLWMVPLNCLVGPEPALIPSKALNLDLLTTSKDYLNNVQASKSSYQVKAESKFLCCMRTARLFAIGHNEADAPRESGLSPKQGATFVSGLTRASLRLPKNETRFGVFNLLFGIPTNRFNYLVEIAIKAKSAKTATTALKDWDLTIGSSRQILLFQPEHFEYFSTFRDFLELGANDIWLVSNKILTSGYMKQIQNANLEAFLRSKSDVSKTFQLDVAKNGDPVQNWPDRIVVIPAKNGKIVSTHELLTLWIVWHLSLQLT